MPFRDTHGNPLGWLLDEQLAKLAGVKCAVLISADGLLSSRTSSVDQTPAEKLAALGSTLRGGGRALSEEFDGGGVRQIVLELDTHVVMITNAGENMLLLVQTDSADADVATINHTMIQLAGQVGHEMQAEARRPTPEAQER